MISLIQGPNYKYTLVAQSGAGNYIFHMDVTSRPNIWFRFWYWALLGWTWKNKS